jgi:hypothetical protein
MVYNIRDYWVFRLCPSSDILETLKNTTFRKLDLFPSSGEEVGNTSPESYHPVRIQQGRCLPNSHLSTERDPVSEEMCIFVFFIIDKANQKEQ